jgi:hypothetical protein
VTKIPEKLFNLREKRFALAGDFKGCSPRMDESMALGPK